MQRELKKYVTGLQKTHPDLAALLGSSPVELVTLQKKLPESAAVVQYLLLPDKTAAFVIRKDDIRIVETKADRKVLEGLVARYRKLVASPKASPEIDSISSELYGMLVEPVEKSGALKGVTTLGISPNGFLHYLPFGALKGKDSKFLVDKYVLFYINSTSMLAVAAGNISKAKEAQSLLAFGNPDGSLPGAGEEVDLIGKHFKKKNVYKENKAVKGKLGKGGDSIIHFATHGILDPLDNTKSHLVMAGSDLTVEEIWGLPLSKTGLVVLSACETDSVISSPATTW